MILCSALSELRMFQKSRGLGIALGRDAANRRRFGLDDPPDVAFRGEA